MAPMTPKSARTSPLPAALDDEAAPLKGVSVDEVLGAPVPEMVPVAAGKDDFPGIGKGAVGLLRTTGAEVVTGVLADELMIVAIDVGTGLAAVDFPKLAGRLMPLSAAHCSGVSPWDVDLVKKGEKRQGGRGDLRRGSSIP